MTHDPAVKLKPCGFCAIRGRVVPECQLCYGAGWTVVKQQEKPGRSPGRDTYETGPISG